MATITDPEHGQDRHKQLAWLVLTVLLLLRIPFVVSVTYFMPIEDQRGGAVYEVGSYLLIALLIWWERDHLSDFHIDSSALFLIIFLRPIQTLILQYWAVDSPLAFPNPFGVAIWIISIALFSVMMVNGRMSKPIPKRILYWLVIGFLAGLTLSVFENMKSFSSMLTNPHGVQMTGPLFVSNSLNLLYHLGFAPISEEPLFRGFLWGCLRQLKLNEFWIWLIQAGLFTLAHLYFVSQYPLQFWVLIPMAGLLFGWLAWRSRSISSGLLAHGLINGSVYILLTGLISLIRF